MQAGPARKEKGTPPILKDELTIWLDASNPGMLLPTFAPRSWSSGSSSLSSGRLPDRMTGCMAAALMAEIHPVILFYKYVSIEEPEQFAAAQRALCGSLRLKGRILIATEGINGTLAGPGAAIDEYAAALRNDARFADVEMKVSPGDAQTFPRLSIKVRPEIVALHAGPGIHAEQHNHLSPAEWKRMLEEEPGAVALDVRNRYESAAGRFENAVVCDIEHFRELPGYLPHLEELRGKKILMYCTGGIRCEKASALLRSRGFSDVHQLRGGIMSYQKEFGNEHWVGECFVFDQRMTVKTDQGLVQIGVCAHTGRTTSRFVNCLHDPCHRLFLLSEEAEIGNPDHRLCPACLSAGLTSATADYNRKAAVQRSASGWEGSSASLTESCAHRDATAGTAI